MTTATMDKPAQGARTGGGRRTAIVEAYLADGTRTLSAVGKEFGVSREWVRQVVRDCGISAEDVERIRATDAEKRRAEDAANLRGALLNALGADSSIATLDELARASAVPLRSIHAHRAHLGTVHSELRSRLRNRQSALQSNVRHYSDEDILRALRRVSATLDGRPVTAPAYVRESGEGEPSLALINTRFGGFVAACTAAGVPTLGHRPKPSRYSEADYLAAIARCAEDINGGDLSALGSLAYASWAQANGKPSLSRVRQIFGNWNRAKMAANKAIS